MYFSLMLLVLSVLLKKTFTLNHPQSCVIFFKSICKALFCHNGHERKIIFEANGCVTSTSTSASTVVICQILIATIKTCSTFPPPHINEETCGTVT